MSTLISLYSSCSKLVTEMDIDDLRWLVRLAQRYGWAPRVPRGDHRTAAEVLYCADHEGPGRVSAQDALSLAVALERARLEFPPAADNDDELPPNWMNLVNEMAAMAAAGPFAVIAEAY
jgi:hypothetical protein